MRTIRFRFSPTKARAAILWMLQPSTQPLDLHTVLKACYFADKEHLNRHARPIFGADYRAMKYGPVPLQIYEMLKGEPLWLPELDASDYPWRLTGYQLVRTANESEPDLDCLSKSDVAAIEHGFTKSKGLDFNERTAATHGVDWQRANLGMMRYEDMLDDEGQQETVQYLRETAHLMRL